MSASIGVPEGSTGDYEDINHHRRRPGGTHNGGAFEVELGTKVHLTPAAEVPS